MPEESAEVCKEQKKESAELPEESAEVCKEQKKEPAEVTLGEERKKSLSSAHKSDAYKQLLDAVNDALNTSFKTTTGRCEGIGICTTTDKCGIEVYNRAYAPIMRRRLLTPDQCAQLDATWATIRALAVAAAEKGAETQIRTGRPLDHNEYFILHQTRWTHYY